MNDHSPSTHTAQDDCVIRFVVADAYRTDGDKLMGRQSANEGFLKAWFKYSGHTQFKCLSRYRNEAEGFARMGQTHIPNWQKLGIQFTWMQQMMMHKAQEKGALFLPGPQVAEYAWRRRRDPLAKDHALSLVGMTHTTCEMSIQDSLANMLVAPVYEWDAQICPSQSVKTMVKRLLDDEAAFLKDHTGAQHLHMPQLPVIPLGVHSEQFATDLTARAQWRKRWGLTEQDVCILYMGRLDLHTKANLFPMFDALQHASTLTQKPLVLVLAGWFASDWNKHTIEHGIAQAMPNVKVIFEDGRTPEARVGVWQAADIFTSLVDNVQETFGLVPIEAMAAGLPCVVTHYDGYKESVRNGIDGFSIRTLQAPAGTGQHLMERHDDFMDGYTNYVGRASYFVGFDIAQAAQAFAKLANEPETRKTMGQAGRLRAQTVYDWKNLIPQYQQLFRELANIRQHATPIIKPNRAPLHPRRADPYHSFSHYPSQQLNGNWTVQLLQSLPAARQTLALQLARPVYQITGFDALNPQALTALLTHIAKQPLTVTQLLNSQIETPDHTLRHLVWLFKVGLIQIAP